MNIPSGKWRVPCIWEHRNDRFSPKGCQRVVLTCSPIRKFQTHQVDCQKMHSFWKGGTCSYFLSFCQQLNSCVPNGLKLSQNIVWQPWKQNLTIIDSQSIHSMSPNIPQSGEIGETRGEVNTDLYFLNTVVRTWPLENWKEFILLTVLYFLRVKYLW